jgi:hypothetical protein
LKSANFMIAPPLSETYCGRIHGSASSQL